MSKDTNNETHAAILAEMRAAAKSTDLFNGEEVGEPLIRGTKVENWADRIEEAVKRELSRAAEDAASKATLDRTAKDAKEYLAYQQPGNAARMREVLEKNTQEAYLLLDILPDEMISAIDAASNVLEESEDALAAPARNCDVLSEEAANKAWEEYRHSNVMPRGGWDFRHIIAWLFAKAEGGAK